MSNAQLGTVPEWFKGVAGFWSQGLISTEEFLVSLEFLIAQEIIKVEGYGLLADAQAQGVEPDSHDNLWAAIDSLQDEVDNIQLISGPHAVNVQIKYVELNDDRFGYGKGWDPVELKSSYLIKDPDLHDNSIVIPFVYNPEFDMGFPGIGFAACSELRIGEGHFIMRSCDSAWRIVSGSTLQYIVVNPAI